MLVKGCLFGNLVVQIAAPALLHWTVKRPTTDQSSGQGAQVPSLGWKIHLRCCSSGVLQLSASSNAASGRLSSQARLHFSHTLGH
jgi:hypothetical protein